ncbi:MAG: TlpA disulfide reductase family protein, partial [Bacteroidales bacterium]
EQINNKKSEYIESFPEGLFTAILKAQKDVPLPEQKIKPDGTPDRQALYNQYLKDYWQNIDLTDERLLRTPVYHQKLNHFFNSVVIQTPDSIISAADRLIEKTRPNDEMFKYTVWYVMNLSEKSKLMGMDALFVHMAENYYLTGDAFWISDEYKEKIAERTEVLKPLLIGSVAPNIKVYTPEKESYALHDVSSKYTALYFWDSECSHCKKVSPALYEVYQNNKEKGLKVFAMNVEMDREKWLNYIKENGFNEWINVHDPTNQSGFRDKYDIYSIPIIYLLDEDKKIIAKEITAKQVEELIDHLEGQEK